MIGRREIGGYMELERFTGPMLHDGDVAMNCGRACLEYLAELRDIQTLWLPDFLCSSVPDLCRKIAIQTKTYRIGEGFRPIYDFKIANGEWLYLVDYYGQLSQADVDAALGVSCGRLVVDESQGYYRNPWENADTLYTCRKWFGVADGAFLHTKDDARLDRKLPRSESFDKMGFVLGRFERPAGEFFAESKGNNVRFVTESMSGMSALTENLLHAIDFDAAKKRRVENWHALDGAHRASNRLNILTVPDAPFMYPYMIEDASGIRQALAAEGIFIPTLWPNVLDDCQNDSVAYKYSTDILPLPVDQRYGVGDMNYLTRVLRSVLQ